jgi:hypothetical protein
MFYFFLECSENSKVSNPILVYSRFYRDPVFKELLLGLRPGYRITTVKEYQRGKRGAIHLGKIMQCATGCNPLTYQGYGCYCGFLGSGDHMDGIDKYEFPFILK